MFTSQYNKLMRIIEKEQEEREEKLLESLRERNLIPQLISMNDGGASPEQIGAWIKANL